MNDFNKDIITALRYQVMVQNKEIMKLEKRQREFVVFLDRLRERTEDKWLDDEIREFLDE